MTKVSRRRWILNGGCVSATLGRGLGMYRAGRSVMNAVGDDCDDGSPLIDDAGDERDSDEVEEEGDSGDSPVLGWERTLFLRSRPSTLE